MAGSSFGTILRLTTWGESHGPAIGAVLDGFPAGMPLTEDDIQIYLDRRRPGQSAVTTSRRESDRVEILSGVFEGRTTGTPISLLIRNTSQRSSDYGDLADCFRPGHADYGFQVKYGLRDYRGGGRSSGRETAGRVAAGAIAAKLLSIMGITVTAYVSAIGPVAVPDSVRGMSTAQILAARDTQTCMPDADSDREARAWLASLREEMDSAGGTVECRIEGLPAGIGDTVFEKLDARLAAALMSIGAVKAVEIGDGTAVSAARGSDNNDAFIPGPDGEGSVTKRTNHSGGILGGMSDGSPVLLRAHFKPTPSIAREQETVDTDGNVRRLAIRGRHDPVIVPRAAVVVETMCALTVLDAMLLNLSARAENVIGFYRK